MGNFKPYSGKHVDQDYRRRSRRAVLKASVGVDGENLPTDLKLVSTALAEAGLLPAGTPPYLIKREVMKAIQHVERTIADSDWAGNPANRIAPSDPTERMIRRAFAEMRFPTSHRLVVESSSPKGVRAVIARGVELAHRKVLIEDTHEPGSRPYQRALLPPITAEALQTNRRLVDALVQTDIQAIDGVVAKRVRLDGKVGFVEVRDFFTVMTARTPLKSKVLADKVKRHLCGKPRRRFIKLLKGVTPTEGDFEDDPS